MAECHRAFQISRPAKMVLLHVLRHST
jgi:hypothetical protein